LALTASCNLNSLRNSVAVRALVSVKLAVGAPGVTKIPIPGALRSMLTM